MAASFPVAASFGQAWAELESHRFQARIEEFMRELERLVKENQEKVRAADIYIRESEDFAALLERAVRKAIAESDVEKRRAYALALFNCVTDTEDRDIGKKIDTLEALDSLNRADLDVLRKFDRPYSVRVADLVPPQYISPGDSEEKLAESVGPLVQSLAKLESRGLIGETVASAGGFAWSGDSNHWVHRWRRKNYTALPFGRTLLKYLDEKA